jgi:hypothetical protein
LGKLLQSLNELSPKLLIDQEINIKSIDLEKIIQTFALEARIIYSGVCDFIKSICIFRIKCYYIIIFAF